MSASGQQQTRVNKAKSKSGSDAAPDRKYGITDIAIPIVVIHLIALAALAPTFFSWWNVLLMLICTLLFGQGINLGYHRLLTHRSLRVPRWLEYFYVGLAICCLEESPGKWVATHRRHHNDSDEHADPHSPKHSFFWSHMGWLMFKRDGRSEFTADPRYSADILNDPFYAALERNPLLPGALYLLHALVFFLIGYGVFWLNGHGSSMAAWSALGALIWGVFVRTVVVWHISWSVNSLSHAFGYQNYATGEGSRNNWLVALFSSGEGWHNNHHHDPASASVQHRWWEFDLTYYHILLLEKLGLAKQVVKPRHVRKDEQGKNSGGSSLGKNQFESPPAAANVVNDQLE